MCDRNIESPQDKISSADLYVDNMSGTETLDQPTPDKEDTQCQRSGRGAFVERLSRYGMHVLPSSFARRSRLQRQREVSDTATNQSSAAENSERGSLTPAMRRQYLKELLLNNASHGGFSKVLSSDISGAYSSYEQDTTDWALYPMEHAWMLAAVDGNYETILEFIKDDPQLLTRKDFISGFSVLHWLAKRGQDDVMMELLKYAENAGIPVNVTLKGSGGLTPLHVAAMHSQYTVIKLLVGAFGADTDAMDYNGKRAWQYLKEDAPLEMKELLGTWDEEHNSWNANNNSSSSTNPPTYDQNSERHRDEVDCPDQVKKSGIWRVGSFRSWLSFFGKKAS